MAAGTFCHYDYIVVGIGGIGSGALYWLAKNAPGKRILGIEQFNLGHNRGGSQDVSRVIRRMYHEDYYAKLAGEAYRAWDIVEKESGLQLVYKTGGLCVTTPETGEMPMLEKTYQTMQKASLSCEMLSGAQITKRWSIFKLPNNAKGIFDPESGLVDAGLANSTHQQLAEARGAKIIENTNVTKLVNRGPREIEVHTNRGMFTCGKVIITAGAWLNDVIGSVGAHIPVCVTQENVSYFATQHLKLFTKARCPVYTQIYSNPVRYIYTLPIHGIGGFKAGIDAYGKEVTGHNRTFAPDPGQQEILMDFLEKHIPKAKGRIMQTNVCLYTMTYDRDFVIDTLQSSGSPDVIVCCGAGHAFKFASVLGRILSELAILGRTTSDIHPQFSLDRPAITDPNFKPVFTHLMGSKL